MRDEVSSRRAPMFGLHPWRMIVERYAGDRPIKLKRSVIAVPANERSRWMRGALGLEHGDRLGLRVHDYASRDVVVNHRVIDHIIDEPQRTPYVTWIAAALQSPLEVWRRYIDGRRGLEPRRYYLFAAIHPAIHNVVVIVGENDGVAFNVIPFEPKDAKKFRLGELLYVRYENPFGRCPHGCCERRELA